jgi:cytochrome c oxidase subunit I+III
MTERRTLDVSGLPPYEISNQSPLFWGQVLMCLIEGSLLCMLIATYFYLRLGVNAWPGPGVHLPGLVFSSWALIPLVASCFGSYLASEAAKKNSRGGMLFGLGLNLALASVFLVPRALEWNTLNFTWASGAHGSAVWAIPFLHSYDIVADMLMTVVLVVIVASGRYGPRQRIGVHVDSVLWYFLVGIWIPLYGVVYWAPSVDRRSPGSLPGLREGSHAVHARDPAEIVACARCGTLHRNEKESAYYESDPYDPELMRGIIPRHRRPCILCRAECLATPIVCRRRLRATIA